MRESEPPEIGTLIIAALLLLALGFAGYWIITYAQSTDAPWAALPWFGGAAVVIVVVGLIAYMRGR